jgi:hypothetical protein
MMNNPLKSNHKISERTVSTFIIFNTVISFGASVGALKCALITLAKVLPTPAIYIIILHHCLLRPVFYSLLCFDCNIFYCSPQIAVFIF